jgi:D-tyrosyl-tRNA(Tyr) deacylase
MRAVVQRATEGSVTVDGVVTGAIGSGLVVLLGIGPDDGPAQVDWLADKLVNLRIFADDAGRMNRSLVDVRGEALIVSQFTLYGDCRKGRRPSFVGAAHPSVAEPLYDAFCAAVEARGIRVGRGVFGGDMAVALVNDGPVTLIVETP